MTDRHDPHDRPGRPGSGPTGEGPGGADDPDRAWFRATVAPVVDAEPVPDDWAAVRARATGQGPTVVAIGPGPRRRPGRLAAAAAMALLAGTVAVLALTGDPAGDPVTTGGGTDDRPTGWYVPTDLPEGWSVGSVELTHVVLECPCRTAVWVTPDRTRSLTFSSEPSDPDREGPVDVDAMALVDLGRGIEAPLFDDGLGTVGISWHAGGRASYLTGVGWEDDDLVRAARIFAAADGTASGFSGLDQILDVTHPADRYRVPEVLVSLTGPDDRELDYSLSTAGGGTAFAGGGTAFANGTVPTPTPATGSGPPWPLLDLVPAHDGDLPHPTYVGTWPGADVRLPATTGPAARSGGAGPPTTAEVERLVASLRPATTEGWRALLDEVGTADARLWAAERLADLGTLPERSTPEPPRP